MRCNRLLIGCWRHVLSGNGGRLAHHAPAGKVIAFAVSVASAGAAPGAPVPAAPHTAWTVAPALPVTR